MDMDFLCSDYYNLFDSLEDWNNLGDKYEVTGNKNESGLIKFGEILYNQNSTSFVYICELCQKSFENIKAFREHIKNEHDFYTSTENETNTCHESCKTEEHSKKNIEKALEEKNIPDMLEDNKNLKDNTNYVVISVPIDFNNDNVIIPIDKIKEEKNADEISTKRSRSPSIMRKANKDSRPIDFISNPWHCECGRIVPITHKYQHMKSHNDVPIYECKIIGCFEIFFRQSELKEHHELIHNSGDPKKPFSCQFCQRHFSNKKNYSTHVKRIHLNDPRHHTCPYCHYYFYSKSYLQQHIYKKHGEYISKHELNNEQAKINSSNNSDIISENNFPSEDFYSETDQTSDSNSEYLCKFCNTNFASNEDLLTHMERLHNVKEISLCRICGCDIDSILHKNNCLRRGVVKMEGIIEDIDDEIIEEKTDIFTYDAGNGSPLENNVQNNIQDEEAEFLKFLNVDFDT